MEKKKSPFGMNNGTLIAVAVGVGVANGVALEDTAIGFGISIAIIGFVMLGRSIEASRRNHNQDI